MGLIRWRSDIESLVLPNFIEMRVDPEDNTIIRFTLDLTSAVESIWVGAKLDFTAKMEDDYPFSPPRVQCNTPVLHPNIDADGSMVIRLPLSDEGVEFDLSTIVNDIVDLMMAPNLKEISNGVAAWQYQVHHSHFREQGTKQIVDQRRDRRQQVYRR